MDSLGMPSLKIVKELSQEKKIQRFIKSMRLNFVVNSGKGGWDEASLEWLYMRLVQEVGELGEALFDPRKAGVVEHETAEIANFALMIEDRYRQVRRENLKTESHAGRPDCKTCYGGGEVTWSEGRNKPYWIGPCPKCFPERNGEPWDGWPT